MTQVWCHYCTKPFYAKPAHIRLGWAKYCSLMCKNKSQLKGQSFNCTQCKKSIYRRSSQISHSKSKLFFCSKKCQTTWRNSIYMGPKSKNWRCGIRVYRNILMRKGDLPMCKLCKYSDNRALVAHHKDHNRNNNDISNLVWLCMNCHHLVHIDKKLDKILRA